MNTKFKNNNFTKEQTEAYGFLKSAFTDRLREVFKDEKFTKFDIRQSKEYFTDLEKTYKDIFKTKWSFFDYDERLSNLIAQTGIKDNRFKMENGTYWFE
jgi:hypothetical protein